MRADHFNGGLMIFIVVKFKVAPEYQETWLSQVREFTEMTRAEEGNLWFEWSRNVDDPGEYVLVEAFQDQDAAVAHVHSEHFTRGLNAMRAGLVDTPRIINVEVPGDDWSLMQELAVTS
jgi:quinol monooxygenase YgiN